MPDTPSTRVNPVWFGLGVGVTLGLLRGDIVPGVMAGLIAWALYMAYLRYKQVKDS